MSQSVKINDKSYPIDVEGDMPLLWFLRDKLELTGTNTVVVWVFVVPVLFTSMGRQLAHV